MTVEEKKRYNHEYGKQNREKINANKRLYAKNNREKLKTYRAEYYRKNADKMIDQQRALYSTLEGRARKILTKAKERARATGLDFNLDITDIVIPDNCPYLGVPLTHYLGKGQLPTNSSIDRIDSTKGYVKGNVRIISRRANSMKTDSTREERIAFAKKVLEDENY